jgi:hypothetical protein
MSETAHIKKTHTTEKEGESKEGLVSAEKLAQSVEAPLEYSPKLIENIEKQAEKMEHNLQMFQELLREVDGNEDIYVAERMEGHEEGKKASTVLQEKMHALIHAYDHSKDHLSEHYDPRVVKAFGSLGKAVGGIGGFILGHGVFSAPASVAGSKAGGYASLKIFQHTVQYLPEHIHEKIKKQPKETVESNEKVLENQKKIEEKSAEKNALLQELSAVTGEMAALQGEQKVALQAIIQKNEEGVMSTATKLKNSYSKYQDAFKNFEKKYPVLATGVEVALHQALHPILGSLELGESMFHAIEMFASAGASEKATNHMFSISHHIKDSIHNLKEKIKSYDPRARAAPAEVLA